MARTKRTHGPGASTTRWAVPMTTGTDDIARGNVGTSDQGPGDVYPENPVTMHTGEMTIGATAPPVWSWTPLIKQALASGRIDVVDPGSGYHRAMYAPCPGDGHAAGIWRIVRGPADAVIAITMRCPTCGIEFAADPDALFLR